MDPSRRSEGYEFVAELYDYVAPYRERPDVEFYVQSAQESGGPVLEIGCGTGRTLVPTARARLEITGLDASEDMLGVCRRRLAQQPEEVRARARLERGDMRGFDLKRSFRLITTPGRPFQHLLTVQEQMACLEHPLAPCGNEVEQLYADFDRSPFGSKYPGELIVVARQALEAA